MRFAFCVSHPNKGRVCIGSHLYAKLAGFVGLPCSVKHYVGELQKPADAVFKSHPQDVKPNACM
jgi:hypothetical protein